MNKKGTFTFNYISSLLVTISFLIILITQFSTARLFNKSLENIFAASVIAYVFLLWSSFFTTAVSICFFIRKPNIYNLIPIIISLIPLLIIYLLSN